jgi:periplasmic protein TonB
VPTPTEEVLNSLTAGNGVTTSGDQQLSGTLNGEPIYKVGDGITQPQVDFEVNPEYSEEARSAKYSGTVLLSLVVSTQGKAENLKVLNGIGFGLDQKALEAVQKWRFIPGMKDGKPVPVRATISVDFRLL